MVRRGFQHDAASQLLNGWFATNIIIQVHGLMGQTISDGREGSGMSEARSTIKTKPARDALGTLWTPFACDTLTPRLGTMRDCCELRCPIKSIKKTDQSESTHEAAKHQEHAPKPGDRQGDGRGNRPRPRTMTTSGRKRQEQRLSQSHQKCEEQDDMRTHVTKPLPSQCA